MRFASLLAAVGLVAITAQSAAADNERDRACLPCHTAGADERAPQIDLDDYHATVHGDEGCIACHDDVENPAIRHEEEDQDLAPVACGNCHAGEAAIYAESVHGRAQAKSGASSEAARCVDCHGSHQIRRADDPKSTTYPLALPVTCGNCHADQGVVQRHNIDLPDAYQQYVKGVHAEGLAAGHLIAASCNDCHGTHNIEEHEDPRSTINRANIVDTCGQCHGDIKAQFETSIHAVPAGAGDDRQRPVCTSCHFSHGFGHPKDPRFRHDLVKECGTCHAALMETYETTYHGKATTLDDASTAKCSDCHGSHAIKASSDPDSTVNGKHKLETCRKCHEGAPAGFELYWAHPDHSNRGKYPVLYYMWLAMTGLLISVFSLFGLHTLLWWIRGTIEFRRARKEGRLGHAGEHGGNGNGNGNGTVAIRRFARYHRVTHAFVIISFFGLAVTGAPLKYADTGWAHFIFSLLGGVSTAGWLHRLFALMTFGYFGAHVLFLLRALYRSRERGVAKMLFGPESPVPNLQDLRDIVAHIRYFLGRGPKPTWDRWTYWEKFDYWAVFWGVAVIGLSGLVLWFPEIAARALPGWAVNIAFLIHSDEALLAMGFIFAVHFFNGHLRHDKFPLDPVIFTGVVSEHEFKEERGREWERMVAAGQVDERRTTMPPPAAMRSVRILGITAWLFGTLLLILIIYAQFLA